MTLRRFDGRAVLVTGAASGIGRAVAVRIAAEGGRMILADRSADGVAETATSIEHLGGSAACLRYDALSDDETAAMVDAAIAVHDGLDAVLNIAGVYHRGHFETLSPADWRRILTINLDSAFLIAQRALLALTRSGGNIVNTASIAGLDGLAYAAPYAAAKAGIIGLTKSLAAEFAHRGVRCNVVCPGRVITAIATGLQAVEDARPDLLSRLPRLLGLKQGARPEDLAGAYAFLASDDARFVSGAVLVVDGAVQAG
ncbi:MAG: SDR family NAD(P)-dependent oxidoreductase [Devosia sp.]|nr:SDR family NAD(P)-dependent oxidoreductase [Devosia sp.]